MLASFVYRSASVGVYRAVFWKAGSTGYHYRSKYPLINDFSGIIGQLFPPLLQLLGSLS